MSESRRREEFEKMSEIEQKNFELMDKLCHV
jgi:hypothetical protein